MLAPAGAGDAIAGESGLPTSLHVLPRWIVKVDNDTKHFGGCDLMTRSTLVVAICVPTALLLWAQPRGRYPDHPPYEVKSVFPHETSPGQYRHVEQPELEALADQGWELVSVMPYIYRNEERGNDNTKPKPVVTQTYPACFFKRQKIIAK